MIGAEVIHRILALSAGCPQPGNGQKGPVTSTFAKLSTVSNAPYYYSFTYILCKSPVMACRNVPTATA